MLSSPSGQALLFAGVGAGDVLLPGLCCDKNGHVFRRIMDESSSWIQSISDYEDDNYFNSAAFGGVQGHGAAPCPVFKQEDRLFPHASAVHWLGGNGPEPPQPLHTMQGYGHNMAAAAWNMGHAATMTGLDAVGLEDYSAWCPPALPSSEPSAVPASSFDVGYANPSFHWPAGAPYPPAGLLGAADPLTMPADIQYPDLGGAGFGGGAGGGDEGGELPHHEAWPLQSPADSWPEGSADSCVLPQAVYYGPPVDHVASAASSPSPGDLSSAASFADVSDMSEVSMRSPCSQTASEASGPATSTTSASGRTSKTLRRASAATKGKATTTRATGRATRSRKKLPSVAATPSPSASGRSPRTRRVSRASPGLQSGASSSPRPGPAGTESPAGGPYQRIQDMDPVSREILDRTLICERGRECGRLPYKVIMSKLQHLFCGAEETLRGHYRRLTKKPEERVRKPVWTPVDLELLRQAVQTFQNSSSGKISWTRVSEYINANGGTYRFGIITCSKKWEAIRARGASAV